MPVEDLTLKETEFARLIEEAYRISAEIGADVEEELSRLPVNRLTASEVYSILSKTIERVQRRARQNADPTVVKSLDGPVSRFVDRIIESQERITGTNSSQSVPIFQLIEHNGVTPTAVKPIPVFHGKSVPVREGYVRTRDISLWDENERLDIHLDQFRKTYGREPRPEEVLSIMLSELNLKGTKTDEFEIQALARSIATNGMRARPILDLGGVPLDGNRRITACNYILNCPEFTVAQKRDVEYIKVWQLTEHTSEEHKRAVVISLNFESDLKKPWPSYIKARKVYDEYQSRVRLNPSAGQKELLAIRKDIAAQYAIDPRQVLRYITMVEWADEFEEHQVADRGRDEFEVKHRANIEFEYFDELSKGPSNGGVAYALNQNPDVKHLVFDLLFEDKFKSWKQIRELNEIAYNEEAISLLQRALIEDNEETAQKYVDDAVAIVRMANAGMRQVGVQTRIEQFNKFMVDLPAGTLTSEGRVKPATLFRLLAVMRLADGQARAAYGSDFDQRVEEAARNLYD